MLNYLLVMLALWREMQSINTKTAYSGNSIIHLHAGFRFKYFYHYNDKSEDKVSYITEIHQATSAEDLECRLTADSDYADPEGINLDAVSDLIEEGRDLISIKELKK